MSNNKPAVQLWELFITLFNTQPANVSVPVTVDTKGMAYQNMMKPGSGSGSGSGLGSGSGSGLGSGSGSGLGSQSVTDSKSETIDTLRWPSRPESKSMSKPNFIMSIPSKMNYLIELLFIQPKNWMVDFSYGNHLILSLFTVVFFVIFLLAPIYYHCVYIIKSNNIVYVAQIIGWFLLILLTIINFKKSNGSHMIAREYNFEK